MAPSAEIRSTLSKLEKLHSNFAVLSRLDALLRDYNSDLSEAESLILSDSNLTASVVRVSNSVIFRRSRHSFDLHAAIQQVGFGQILTIVGAALARQAFLKDLHYYRITARQYWFSSFFSALLLEKFEQHNNQDADLGYLLGLLHCIGKVLVNESLRLREPPPPLPETEPDNRKQWEIDWVGISSDACGSLLLQSWSFPKRLCQLVEDQSLPLDEHASFELIALDFCKHLLAANRNHQDSANWNIPQEHALLSQLDFDAESIRWMIEETRQRIRLIESSF